MASRLNLARLGAAVLGAATALVLSAALPANADSAPSPSSTATVNGDDIAGTPLNLDYTDGHGKNGTHQVTPVLIGLKLADGTVVHTYCIELNVELNPKVPMKEAGWDAYPDANSLFNKNNTEINWILHHSFPQVSDLSALSRTAGLGDTISKADAIAGTQAAIWHYSDGANLAGGADADITGLFKYLTGSANAGQAQPTGSNGTADPKLSIDPTTEMAGAAGDKIGPFTVSTNMTGLELASQVPSGVTLVDGDGNTLDPAKITNGTKVYFKVPAGAASGAGSFTLSSPDTIGELFVGTSTGQSNGGLQTHGARSNCAPQILTQSLIIAQTSVSATAKANWAAGVVTSSTTPSTGATTPVTSTTSSTPAVVAPTSTTPAVTNTANSSSLPFTGVSLFAPIALAIVLIGGGGTFLLLQRRKKA
jgi:TQXA domain-containing protein